MSPSCTFAPFFTVGTNFHFFFLSMGSATTPLLIMSPLCCLIISSGLWIPSKIDVTSPGARQCPQRVGLLLRSTLHLLPSRHQTSSLPSCPRLRLQGQIF